MSFPARRFAALLMLAVVAGAPDLAADAAPSAVQADHAQHLRTEPLSIATGKGTFRFSVEVADTFASRERGLMFRTSLAADKGMLFDFKTPRLVAFWMKNTLIPLDMLFIGQNGQIVSIAANAAPRTLTPIPSGGAVVRVLELRGGRAAEIGAAPGDQVTNRIFRP